MKLNLNDRVAIVTGGASGIGWACTKLFLEEEARVIVWDLSEVDAGKIGELTPQAQSRITFRRTDVTSERELEQAVGEAMDTHETIDHLVHAAAIGSGKFGFPFTHLQPTDWLKTLDINIMGTVRVCHAIAPRMIERKSGSICLIGSVAGQIGSQTDPPYSASKAANINFAQCMAKDLAPHGIRVNVVNPGMVQTPLNRSVWKAWHDLQPVHLRQSYEEWAGEKVKKVVPLGRWQTVEDVANAVVFLASARAMNITGQCINVDGGFVMHS